MRFQALAILLSAVLVSSGQTHAQAAAASPAVRTHLRRAEAALRTNDTATAERELRAVLALSPANAEANTNLGILALSRGEFQSACGDFRKAHAAEPSLAQAEALLGICERRLGDASATKHLEHSFARIEDPKLQTQAGMELVGIYYAEGNPERAVAITQKLVELNPEDPDILYTAQRLYNELADATLNKLAIVAPGSARMQQVIAEHLINAGDLPSAIQHYQKALEIEPSLHGVRYELAQAILETSQFDSKTQQAAIAMATEAARVEGNSANLACLLARIALLQDDESRASALYREAIGLDPDSTEAQAGMGRVLMSQDKPAEARKYLLMAIGSDPLNSAAHYRLLLADRKLGLHDEAQKEAKLVQEIKATRDNVEKLYRQMHKQSKFDADERESSEDSAQ